MARKPNYSFERRQREIQRAAKKAERQEAKKQRVQRRREGEEDSAPVEDKPEPD